MYNVAIDLIDHFKYIILINKVKQSETLYMTQDTTRIAIGERIRQFRQSSSMSQQELADALGFKSGTAISLIESGARGTSAEDIPKFAKVLGVNPSDLLGESSSSPDFSTVLRADKQLTKRDKEDILNFYQHVKRRRG